MYDLSSVTHSRNILLFIAYIHTCDRSKVGVHTNAADDINNTVPTYKQLQFA